MKSLGTVIAIILVVCIAGVGVYFVYDVVKSNQDAKEVVNQGANNTNNTNNTNNANNANNANPTPELSVEDAKSIYNKALSIYWYDGFNMSKDTVELQYKDTDSKMPSNEVLNYDEVMASVFNEKGKIQHLKNPSISIFESDSKIYSAQTGRGADTNYVSTELTQKSFNDTRIEYVAKSKYIDSAEDFPIGSPEKYTGDKFEYKEASFVLVKENGKWLVEDFTLPN